jgi:serine protease inhibitor
LSLLNDRYGAPLQQLDFMRSPEPSRATINGWVDDKTEHKIPALLPPGTIDPTTRLVLTNATYFKAAWVTAFAPNATQDGSFTVTSDKVIPTKLMHRQIEASYAETGDAQVLELPYNGGASMVIVLPKDKDGLGALEKTIVTKGLDAWTASLAPASVDTTLPRFKTSAQFSLKQTLSQMGMPIAFTTDADFSGIDGAKDLDISAVIHQAVIDVDEKGTEAAAATAVVIREMSARIRELERRTFRADHPFLYFLRDRQGRVLFMGRLVNPQAA